MIVHGRGMLASAFLARRPAIDAALFARGVADSTSVDEEAYERERSTLRDAVRAAAERGHPLIYFSSAPVYGHFGDEPVSESDPPRPVTPYGRHKLDCEAIVRESPGPSLVLRLPNVVGPGGHPHQLVPSLVRQVVEGRVTVLGGAARDLLDVDDLVSITGRLVAADAVGRAADLGRTINVATGICTPVREMVDEIISIVGGDPIVDVFDGGEAQRFSVERLGQIVGERPYPADYVARLLRRRVPAIAEAMAPATIGASLASAT
jgi:nucleoside-diphosphate-sugar epimerase